MSPISDIACFICVLAAITTMASGDLSPIVTTKSGQVRGKTVEMSPSATEAPIAVYQFTAIPFAEPPVGPLRFKKPRPVKPWSAVLDALMMPNACSQNPMPFPPGGDTGVEDCLYLNVWVPRGVLDMYLNNPTATTPLSVFIYIHGGGFASGFTKDSSFNGTYLSALNNIIVVTIQYRLGSLGFAYMANDDVPGNMGLWDQLEAIKWVSENIESFAGNKNQVTIGGESAGAVSTSWHLLSPNSKKYFHRAIIQSGTAISPWGRNSAEVALAVTNMVFHQICNGSTDAEQMKCLMAADAKKFPPADKLPDKLIYEHILHPVTAGDFLPRDPETMLKSGDFYDVPLLIGANRDEGSMFVAFTEVGQKILGNIHSINDLNINDYNTLMNDRFKQLGSERWYPNSPNQLLIDNVKLSYWPRNHEGVPKGEEVFKAVSDAHGEMGMLCPSYVWANATAKKVSNVFVYHFTQGRQYSPQPGYLGVMHGDDIAFMFGVPFAPPSPFSKFTDEEKLMSRVMMTYWGNFIKYGNPNGAGGTVVPGVGPLRNWPQFSSPACPEQYFVLNYNVTIRDDTDPAICSLKEWNCLFWHDHMIALTTKLNLPPSPLSSPISKKPVGLLIILALSLLWLWN